jgi:septal ring factor EnvC (AmiA/AmiB activator)
MLTGSPNTEVELTRRIIYLRALADLESDFVAQAETYLAQSQQQLSRLIGEREKVYRLKKKKETATALEKSKKTQQQKALERLRRKKLEEADRILTLQQAAEEMARIIGRLEQERKRRLLEEQAQPGVPSAFAALKGQLASPCRGKIVVGFGYSVDPVTKLKSFSPGITIKGKAGRPVTAVADGTVAYGGRLRGYGNFVIINHDGQFYTTYGGLDRILVETNEYVLAGTKLGTAGADGLVKFELRRGREPLDPVKWIRIDVF